MSDEDLQNMSVPKLRGYCRNHGVKGYGKVTNKEDLIRLIRQETECGICLENKETQTFIMFPKCKHKMCFGCAVTVIRTSSDCPFCRDAFSESSPNPQIAPKEDIPDVILEDLIASSTAHGMSRYVTGMFEGEETPLDDILLATARHSASMVRQWYSD